MNQFLIRLVVLLVLKPLIRLDAGIYNLRRIVRRWGGLPPLPPRH